KVVSNLAATANSPTSATIAFIDTNSGLSPLYLLERSADGMSYQVVDSLGSSVTATQCGLTPGATYYFRVRATSWSAATSDYSAPVSITMPNLGSGTPVPPSGLQVTDQSATSVLLTWTNNDPSNPQFKIERAPFDPYHTMVWSQVAVTGNGVTSF